jgi:flagellar hook-associated protein 3 FlgL
MSGFTPATQTGSLVSNARMTTDGGASFTAVDFASTNQTVHDSRTDTTLNVDSTGITRTGTDDVKFGGTFDVFTSLLALRDALANTTGLGDVEAGHRISSLVNDLDFAHDAVLKGLQEHGGRAERLTLMGRRLDGLELTLTESLSREQDTDIAEAILDLNKSDLTYRASLAVGARLLQTSLLDFLR